MPDARIKTLEDYSPADLYAASWRHSDGMTVDEASAKYLEMHPGADAAKVRREIEAVAG